MKNKIRSLKEKNNEQQIIWIVDDDASILEMIELLLVQDGYTVKSFNKGKGVLLLLHKEQPDLILLDVILGDSNGYEIGKEIKETKQLKDLRVVLMSGNTNVKKLAKDAKVDAHISKPFDIKVFLSVINKAINKKGNLLICQ